MKKFWRSSVATALLFIMATIMLFAGTIGGAQAALNRQSQIYDYQISLKNIGVTLVEKYDDSTTAQDISYRNYDPTYASGQWSAHTGNLVKNMVESAGDNALKIGKRYPLQLSVRNTGSIDQYVRVSIYKYWVDASGNKITGDAHGWFTGYGVKQMNMDPALIKIELANTGAAGPWVADAEAQTDERIVLRYNGILGVGEPTPPFTSSVTIDGATAELLEQVTDTFGNTTSTYSYAADGIGFVIETVVDAVQDKNSEHAIPSAWGHN